MSQAGWSAAVGCEAFLAHPAPADATLHLGAVGGKPGGPTLVPAGLAGLRSGGQGGTQSMWSGWAVAGECCSLSTSLLRILSD